MLQHCNFTLNYQIETALNWSQWVVCSAQVKSLIIEAQRTYIKAALCWNNGPIKWPLIIWNRSCISCTFHNKLTVDVLCPVCQVCWESWRSWNEPVGDKISYDTLPSRTFLAFCLHYLLLEERINVAHLSPQAVNNREELKLHVYGKPQTLVSSWYFSK